MQVRNVTRFEAKHKIVINGWLREQHYYVLHTIDLLNIISIAVYLEVEFLYICIYLNRLGDMFRYSVYFLNLVNYFLISDSCYEYKTFLTHLWILRGTHI